MTDAKDVSSSAVRVEFGAYCHPFTNPIVSVEGGVMVEIRLALEVIRLRAEVATLTRERDEARDAFDTVISLAPIYCERLHHTKKDYHESGEPCPVEARIKTLIQIIEGDA